MSREAGFTTPDVNEALVKRTALEQCRRAYVLADHTKFQVVSAVTFASLEAALVLTDNSQEGFEEADVTVCQ